MINIPAHIQKQLQKSIIWGRLTTSQKANFLATLHHESNGFEVTVERFNYTPIRLFQVFSKRIPSIQYAKILIQQGQRVLANHLYNGRMGNELNTNDGYNYRGRGYIQLTGRKNYENFSLFIGQDVVADPNLVAEKYALESAFYYFEKNGLWAMSNKTDSESIKKLRKAVNGGYNGLTEVAALTKQYEQIC